MAVQGEVVNASHTEGDSRDVLRLQGVEAAYHGAVALRGVSLSVPSGAAVALLGANGAGKSTTIRAVMGLLPTMGGAITGGSIEIMGESATDLASHQVVRRGLAHVPEGRLIFADMSIDENLDTGLVGRSTPGEEETRERIFEMFPILRERRKQAGGLLSGGEQQMLAIGRALMADPSLILLDEVSLGLAPLITRSIFEKLRELRQASNVSMLIVEQNAKLALEFCDYAYVIEGGRIVHEGEAAALRDDPQVQELYLGGEEGEAGRSFAQAKRLRRRKRWLS